MKTAVIGMGTMGSQYAVMLLEDKIPGMELAAATRIGAGGAAIVAGKLPQSLPIYKTADELFAAYDSGAQELDAVIIATPHYSHEDMALKAFARGLSVLCEKPAGVYSRQARNMLAAYGRACEAAQDGKRPIYGFMFQQRTFPVYREIKRIIQSGEYGGIKRVNWVVTDWYRPNAYYTAAAWRGTWRYDGGGTLLNQCPHNLDMLQWLCGLPARVQAFCHEGKYHPIEVEDEVTAYFEWAGGATGVLIASTGEGPGVNRLEISLDDALIVCEEGSLRLKILDKPEKEYRTATGVDLYAIPGSRWREVECAPSELAYEKMLANFARCFDGSEELIAPGGEAIKSLYLSNAMYLSSWQKRMVCIPAPDTEAEKQFEAEFEAELARRKV